MRYIKGFYMSLGMFTGIPLPFHIWDNKLTSIMVASLPLIGAIIGLIWWAAALLLIIPSLPLMMVSAILTVVPFFVAGFIHLDGYMDTSDARLSYRSLDDKLRILKDPTVGAFSVVMLVILFFLQFAAVYSIVESGRHLALLIAICTVSRGCSAFSIFVLRHMPESNYTANLGRDIGFWHKVFIVIAIVGTAALSFLYSGFAGLAVVFAVVLGYVLSMRIVYKDFGGVSGDLLGYSLVISELCGLIALALLQGVTTWF